MERAKQLFGARYANVQPHSCSSANLAVLSALLRPGDTLLGLDLDAGGHLTHGSRASVSGRHYRAVSYGLDHRGLIDFTQVAELAREHRPRVLIAGASAYPRTVAVPGDRQQRGRVPARGHLPHRRAGRHGEPGPVDVAHLTTTSTYKQLGGPRGGLTSPGGTSTPRAPTDASATG
ncbi:serine hydroxymethyltransferase [Streptomyces violaceorubidus]